MCPPGPRLRQPERARARRAPPRAGARATTSTGTETAKGQRKDPPDSPFTPAVSLFMALDVALEMIEEEGLEEVFERHRLLGRAARAGGQGARARAVRPRGRELERRHRDQAAGVDRRRQGAEDDARQVRHHDRRRPEPAEGQDRAHRPLRLLRRLRHRHHDRRARDDAEGARRRRRARAPASAAAQRVFLEAGVPVGRPREPRPARSSSRRRSATAASSCCATPASTSSSASTGRTASSSAGSASSTAC